ncbi:hypothetical protein ALC62_14122 [Cyphomyrmex costatus]|uniref:Uncharacterized protein n=1 Tax=Cyphomyrmex costatus TaxID=456900 RepID=A0A195C2Z6_9HYME|nr:hypothetical protein ALC62_14122 [Cyphomyrmex costatus]
MRSPRRYSSFVNRPWSERGERSTRSANNEGRCCTINETRRFDSSRMRALKGKSFKLRERKKNAFLLIPDKYVGKRAAESAALCPRSNGFVKLCWYAANARSMLSDVRRRMEKERLPGCFGNFELLRWRSAAISSVASNVRDLGATKIKVRFIAIRSYIRKEEGRRLGGGNRPEGRFLAPLARTYSLHTAHSLKDNYSFAIDLKISEILASAEPFPVEKYRRRGAGVGEKVPRKGDASGCERKAGREPGGRRKGGKGAKVKGSPNRD